MVFSGVRFPAILLLLTTNYIDMQNEDGVLVRLSLQDLVILHSGLTKYGNDNPQTDYFRGVSGKVENAMCRACGVEPNE